MKAFYTNEYLKENLMGPNPITIIDELLRDIKLKPGMRVMDLGCGKGLTSMYLADHFDIQVFAVDLWITATENNQRFKQMSLADRIIPVHADALDMPFANEFFDAVISVDSYNFFGRGGQFLDTKLAPLVKKDGVIAISVPGLKYDIHDSIPEVMKLSWTPEAIDTLQTCEWWSKLFCGSKLTETVSLKELQCFDQAWADWLSCDNEYAVSDRPAMNAGAGKYMNLISAVLKRI